MKAPSVNVQLRAFLIARSTRANLVSDQNMTKQECGKTRSLHRTVLWEEKQKTWIEFVLGNLVDFHVRNCVGLIVFYVNFGKKKKKTTVTNKVYENCKNWSIVRTGDERAGRQWWIERKKKKVGKNRTCYNFPLFHTRPSSPPPRVTRESW